METIDPIDGDMSNDRLAELMGRIPSAQQKTAYIKIAMANKYGWTAIDVWTDDKRADEKDLVGISPSGDFDFLPEVNCTNEYKKESK
jgi:hypothetical protein